MAQKKDTPASTQPKDSKKKTSRRTFGKQLTGALAALPLASMITTPGASALASELSDTKSDTKRPQFKPPVGIWNGPERFRAIAPAIGVVTSLLVEEEAEYAPVLEEALAKSSAAQRQINDALAAAAKSSGASVDQIRTWMDAFLTLGKGGLMAEIPVLAAECAANLNGTWELSSRFSGGVETAARSQIYFDMDPATGSGRSVITLSTEVNFFEGPAPATPINFIGYSELQFTQNGPYEVIGNSVGTTYGNFPGYENGLRTTDSFRLIRRGQNETMVGRPTRTESNGSDTAARTLVEVGGDPGTIKYKLWGSLATATHPRTLDTVDTYVNMSSRRPLVGGWEPIADYFERVSKSGLFRSPIDLKTLRRASEAVAIPRLARP
jgi:hypothetical protein